MSTSYDNQLNDWVNKEKSAVSLLNSVGTLMYDKGIELVLFRNKLLEIGVSELLNYISYANNVVGRENNIETATLLAKEMLKMNLSPSKIDIGLLTAEYIESKDQDTNVFLSKKLSHIINADTSSHKAKDVILYGFGRIGRLAARELIKQAGVGQQLRLKAIVVRRLTDAQIIKRADLLRTDSVHGSFKGVVDVDLENSAIIVNGQVIKFIDGGHPEDIDYTKYGIEDALLIDNTGAFTDKESLSRHLKAKGVSKVLLTAPGKKVPNIVYGINSKDLDIEDIDIFSAASCTTNCIAPILHVLENKYGVVKGHLETVHSYTNDQNLIDNFHTGDRRGRSAPLNMVITSTGAVKAVAKAIPELNGKLTGNAIRVPTPNVSLAVLVLNLKEEVAKAELNEFLKNSAFTSKYRQIIGYTNSPEAVSTDFYSSPFATIIDSQATIAEGNQVTLYCWYDNEFGYSKQVLNLTKKVAKIELPRFPKAINPSV